MLPCVEKPKSPNSLRKTTHVQHQSNTFNIDSKIVKQDTADPSVWQTWTNVTSLHGFTDYTQQYGKVWKIFWILCILFGFIMVIRGIVQLVDDYYDSPTATQTHKYAKSTLDLPDLIICPLQALNETKLKSMDMNQDLIDGLWFTFRGAGLQQFVIKQHLMLNSNLSEKWYSDYKRFKLANNNIKPKELLSVAGVQCESFFVTCNNILNPFYRCCDNVQEVYDQTYGKCFRLKNTGQQIYAGEGSGISVLLNLTYYRQGLLFPGAIKGVAVEAVHPGYPSNIKFKHIPMNSVSQLALTYIHSRTENIAYLKPFCRNYDYSTPNDINDIGKSTTGCYYRVYGDYVKDVFQCVPFNIANNNDERECDFFELEYKISRISLENYTKMMRDVQREQSHCLPSCENHEYSVDWSFVNFDPSYFYRAYIQFRQAIINTSDNKINNYIANLVEFSDGDYVVLDVHYKDMSYTESNEVFVFTFDNLISNVGGTLGLWLGASILSVVQLFAYCFRWGLVRCFHHY